MMIKSIQDIENSDVLYSAGWILDTFIVEKFRKIKRNKKSYTFKYEKEYYVVEIDLKKKKKKIKKNIVEINLGGVLEARKSTYSGKTTININKILYSKIPFFTTREEVINHIIQRTKEETERCKRKIEIYPILIKFLEKIKQKEYNIQNADNRIKKVHGG